MISLSEVIHSVFPRLYWNQYQKSNPLTMNIVHRKLTDQKVILHQGSPNIVKSNAFHFSLTHGSMSNSGL
jgi:hypothetical protein